MVCPRFNQHLSHFLVMIHCTVDVAAGSSAQILVEVLVVGARLGVDAMWIRFVITGAVFSIIVHRYEHWL